MNILFVEDETALMETAVMQLELRGYTVFPVGDLSAARAVMEDPDQTVNMVIADHRLPDGLGVHFVIEMKERFPRCEFVIVSACLIEKDINMLIEHEIPYYSKPLLYAKVVEDLRRARAMRTPSAPTVVSSAEPSPEAEAEPEAPAKKGLFGFLKRKL